GMPSQGVDSTPGPADVAKNQLQHRGRPDGLSSRRMLGPAYGIYDGPGFFHIAALANRRKHLCGLYELVLRHAGNPRDHLGRVSRILLLEQLEHTTRVLQRKIVSDIRRKSRRWRWRRCGSSR